MIKFRAYCEYCEEYTHFKDFTHTIHSDLKGVLKGLCHLTFNNKGQKHDVVLEDLEQFTGLQDKNDKDIYVGDIVKFEDMVLDTDYQGDDASYEVEQVAQVIYDKYKGVIVSNFKIDDTDLAYEFDEVWYNTDLERFWKSVEVIGNINENKELLE